MASILLAFAGLVAATTPLATVPRVLMIGTLNQTSTQCDSMQPTLDYFKLSAHTLNVPKEGITEFPLSLDKKSYDLIVYCVDQASYDYGGSSKWRSALSTEQKTLQQEYQKKFNVRSVAFTAFPSGELSPVDQNIFGCCDSEEQLLRWAPASVLSANMSVIAPSEARDNSGISTLGAWHYPTESRPVNSTITPVMYFDALSPRFQNPSIAAAIERTRDGVESLRFYFALPSFRLADPKQEQWAAWAGMLEVCLQWGLRDTKYTGYVTVTKRQIELADNLGQSSATMVAASYGLILASTVLSTLLAL